MISEYTMGFQGISEYRRVPLIFTLISPERHSLTLAIPNLTRNPEKRPLITTTPVNETLSLSLSRGA